jgi:hypothetical protein
LIEAIRTSGMGMTKRREKNIRRWRNFTERRKRGERREK